MYVRIILDTNIYRQLGQTFYKHVDYLSLEDYCYSSGADVLIPQTVLSEYLDFYQKEVLDKNIKEIEKAFERLKRLSKFKKMRVPSLGKRSETQLNFIKKKLTEHRRVIGTGILLEETDLIDFLIENKQEGKKDNTRDFLIWLSTLFAAMQYPDHMIVLISEDRIFSENEYFRRMMAQHEVEHVQVYKNIPAFLNVFGFRSAILTAEMILRTIPIELIKKELLDQKDAIPSHISRFYYHTKRSFHLEEFELQGIWVDSFYAHKDILTGKVEIIAHIMCKVKMVYEPEPDKEALYTYLSEPSKDRFYLDTFDAIGRPLFHEEMLFTFRLTFDEAEQQITSVEYLDFFPDEYQTKLMRSYIDKNGLD
jgi:hypothetical protein